MKLWITQPYANDQLLTTILVYPTEDLYPHTLDDNGDCQCHPRIEHDVNGKIIIHNSFDGRELLERKFTDVL